MVKNSEGLSVASHPELKAVVVTFNDRSLNFYVTGELKPKLKEAIQAAVDEDYQHVVLNMEKVKVIDSCGTGLIIMANNTVYQLRGEFYLAHVRPFIRKIFQIMRIDRHLNTFETEGDALKAVQEAVRS